MRLNPNYLKIFSKKEKSQFLLYNIIAEAFKNVKITKRQKFWWIVSFCLLGVAFMMKAQGVTNVGTGDYTRSAESFKTMKSLVGEMFSSEDVKLTVVAEDLTKTIQTVQQDLVRNFSGIDTLKKFLKWIANIQIDSIEKVNNLPFGSRGMFDIIFRGLTIFAVIGCLYKLIVHFLNTERHDNVKAYTGYFQYLSIAVLFTFSDTIVDKVVGLNEGINTQEIKVMTTKLDKELDSVLKEDLQKCINDIKFSLNKIQELQTDNQKELIGVETKLEILKETGKIWKIAVFDANFAILFKYIYFTTFISILCSIMALPAFILSVMVKILLTVMVAGAKIVFLLAFIPGFESTWKTFMLNMLNILLWTPIFNAIYSFIVALVISMMSDASLSTGQIIWLTLVSVILAFQTLSLTTSAAGVVINGAGASMAGAMGSITTMSGANIAMGVAKAGVGVAGMAVGGMMAGKATNNIANSIGNSVSSAMDKYMKK